MALQGTIDSFPLSDVLALLSASSKSGCLSLSGDRGRGVLWISDGEVVTGSIDGRDVEDASNLVFELLRFHDAEFDFDDRANAPDCDAAPVALATCVANAAELLERWDAIEAVLPSAMHLISLAQSLEVESVTIDAQHWPLIVAAGRTTTLRGVCDEIGLDEFSAGAGIAQLVDAGILSVAEPLTETEPLTEMAPPLEPDPLAEPASTLVPEMELGPDTELVPAIELETALEPEAGTQSHISHFLDAGDETAESEPVSGGFPERFPIDDLIGEEEPSQELWREPLTIDHGARESSTAAAWDEIVEDVQDPAAAPEQEPDGTDEVLRQMSKLSPQAAEAIAAALNSSGPPAQATAPESDPEGPVSFLGSF